MAVKAIPDGYHSVTPYFAVRGAAEAIEFYKQAFGAEEMHRMPMPGGKIGHAEICIGNSRVMLCDEFPEMGFSSPATLNGSPTMFMIYVENVDEAFKRAIAAGGKELRPVQDQFYGDRSGTLIDPFGHGWTIATHKEDLTLEQIEERSKKYMAEHPECAG